MKTRGVENGTPIDGNNLCRSCRYSTIARGLSENQQIVKCSVLNKTVNFKVVNCSNYDDKSKPSLISMSQIAWSLVTDRKKQTIGFVSPKEFYKNKDNYETPPGNNPGHFLDV